MPRQSRFKQKLNFPRRSTIHRGLNTASKALVVANQVRRLVNVEYKSKQTTFTVDPNSSGAVLALTNIAQGDELDQRDGQKIRAKYISVGGNILQNGSSSSTITRLMIVRDNNGSTTQPSITSLFASAADFFNGKLKLGDPQTNSRFSILWDKVVITDLSSNFRKNVQWSSSLDHHIFYSGTAGTDEGKGHLYLFIASNEATNDPVVAIRSMVKYLDN